MSKHLFYRLFQSNDSVMLLQCRYEDGLVVIHDPVPFLLAETVEDLRDELLEMLTGCGKNVIDLETFITQGIAQMNR